MVVKASASEPLIIEVKAQGADKVEVASCIGSQPDNISGIGGYLGLKEDDMQHAV